MLVFVALWVLWCPTAVAEATVRAAALVSPTTDHKIHLERVKIIDVDLPRLTSDTALIRVAAASVNPCDWKFPFLMPNPAWRYPKVLLHDFAGTILGAGTERSCSHLTVGAAVWGMSNSSGAEIVAVPCRNIGLAPSSLKPLEAAVLPLVALTGLQGFRWAGGSDFFKGSTVLVLGGSGGTGHTGIQLAKAFGAARVIATSSAQHADFVRSVGADDVIDYHKKQWQEVVTPRSVDMIYDTVCQDGTGDLAFPLLKNGGRFVTLLPGALASAASTSERPSVEQTFYMLTQTSVSDLEVLRQFVDSGKLHGRIASTFPLDDVRLALEHSIAGHIAGKLAIYVAGGGAPEFMM